MTGRPAYFSAKRRLILVKYIGHTSMGHIEIASGFQNLCGYQALGAGLSLSSQCLLPMYDHCHICMHAVLPDEALAQQHIMLNYASNLMSLCHSGSIKP